MGKAYISMLEKQYKTYMQKASDLEDELNDTPKIFKHKREKLLKQIEDTQQKADNYFNKFINQCEDDFNNIEKIGGKL